jgi:hypothetical protein
LTNRNCKIVDSQIADSELPIRIVDSRTGEAIAATNHPINIAPDPITQSPNLQSPNNR